MGTTENAGFNAKIQLNIGLDFVKKTAIIIAKTSTSLQLSVSDTLIHVNFATTFATADPRYTITIYVGQNLANCCKTVYERVQCMTCAEQIEVMEL